MTNQSIYTVGGTVQAGGGIYIPRKADEELLELCRAGEFAFILSSRQVGKSSLMVRTAQQLGEENIRSVIIDLSAIGVNISIDEWYLGILNEIANELDLETDIFTWWSERAQLGQTNRLVNFFRDVLLKEVEERVVLFFDEIDSTLSIDFSDDFFAALRSIYNARSTTPDFSRLSFVLIGVATPSDLISDSKRTPFNIGRRVDLTDFSIEEAADLAKGINSDADEILKEVFAWTGGHPYLTQRLCQYLAHSPHPNLPPEAGEGTKSSLSRSWERAEGEGSLERNRVFSKNSVSDAVETLFKGEGGRNDNNLQFVRDMLLERAKDPAGVLRMYRKVLKGKKTVEDDEQSLNKSHLKLSGVVRRREAKLKLSNRVYREVFTLSWARENILRIEKPKIIIESGVAIFLIIVVLLFSSGWLNSLIYRPIDPTWVDVPAGEFIMGADAEQGYRICIETLGEDNCDINWHKDEEPVHTVYLDSYEIMAYEVTNEEYGQCVKAGVCEDAGFKEYDEQGNLTYDRLVDDEYKKHPVVSVTWFQAAAYCTFIDARLPSEAEWEKAARGTDGYTYPWGGEIDSSYANYDLNVGDTTPVGSYEKGISPYGTYDMAGNVWEWTADWYDVYPGGDASVSEYFGEEVRVLRGGSWFNLANYLRSANRSWFSPSLTFNYLGFRCSRSRP